ncbi:chorismate mutase / prephenate dehydratase [Butyrivibrio hungatei DSM 14810]|uniref:Bifunctional chorismate mutase/prephenate dehydratase n=2 Tax=Butyrivibrio hungatei TaxID=185008 RepID=A0A1D9P216_9FIRM|nr:prephenate dehydratase [Butyrivibrio hungatei]AOZ96657.1 prephenate dehydratase/chorismate mutase [Butyrivibrio hungatei]SHN55537.1 chorismate mutase / prephenate dehydratase [Butyrivibrio hungatei DSM 14810]
MDLKDLRSEIDIVDKQIVELFEKRMDIASQVADYKIATGKKVFDREREEVKLQAVQDMTTSEFNKVGVKELFSQLMSMSRKLQYQKLTEAGASGKLPFIEIDSIDKANSRVCFQGAAGSYSEEAMKRFFGEDVNSIAVETFRDAMAVLEDGSCDYAVLPIENSTAGVVSEIYDLLAEYEHYIVGEQIIEIKHCLMGVSGATLEDIKTVYSHPQSLMQSAKFLSDHSNISQISMKNNAFAAKKVAEDGDKSQAAIASKRAADVYGLEVIEEGVNQADSNSTRFIIVTNQKVFLKSASKISICMEIPHETGALYHLMSHFIYNGLNMTKIESRPIEDRNWEYRFFIDFEGNLSDSAVKNALRGLREEAKLLRILGNY